MGSVKPKRRRNAALQDALRFRRLLPGLPGLGARRFFAALSLALACAITAAEAKPVRVVTTILPIYCFASAVIGTNGEVQNLLPPNVGPHDYQLSPSDLRKLRDADLIIFNGLGLDNWITKAADKSRILDLGAGFKKELIKLGSDLEMEGKHQHGHDHQHGPANPHIWLDPQLAIQCVSNILVTVQKIDPSRSADYAKNAEAYIVRLQKLDAEIAAQLTPVREKPFISQHDAFPYFIRRYQLKQVGVVEVTADVPPSPRYLADLLKVSREKKVQVIFNAPPASARLVKQIARDAKIRTAELNTIESGKVDVSAYEDGMRRNAETLRRELEK
jgi:zinc transport system substrate-binding protein